MAVRSEYAKAMGARLRDARTRQGLSLAAVEAKSGGRWPAITVGSYERGDRGTTVERIVGLAEFYGVPARDLLLPPENTPPQPPPGAARLLSELAGLLGVSLAAHETDSRDTGKEGAA